MPAADNYERSVRFSHALYGAIIITAELVIEQDHADDANEVIWALLATGAVLFLAHTYAAVVANRSDGTRHSIRELAGLLIEELPVLTSLVVPLVMFGLATADVVSLTTAFRVSIWTTVLFLFLFGLVESLRTGRGRIASFAIGLFGAVIGILVILLEVWIS